MKRALLAIITLALVFTAACGMPQKQVAPTQPTQPTPAPNLPSMAGKWVGDMNWTVLRADLTLTLNQDASGNLTGTAASVYCEFSYPVSGTIYSDGQFAVQTSDGKTIALSGKDSSSSATGNLALGGSVCGPRPIGTFALQEQ
jgi:hypothetical protein